MAYALRGCARLVGHVDRSDDLARLVDALATGRRLGGHPTLLHDPPLRATRSRGRSLGFTAHPKRCGAVRLGAIRRASRAPRARVGGGLHGHARLRETAVHRRISRRCVRCTSPWRIARPSLDASGIRRPPRSRLRERAQYHRSGRALARGAGYGRGAGLGSASRAESTAHSSRAGSHRRPVRSSRHRRAFQTALGAGFTHAELDASPPGDAQPSSALVLGHPESCDQD